MEPTRDTDVLDIEVSVLRHALELGVSPELIVSGDRGQPRSLFTLISGNDIDADYVIAESYRNMYGKRIDIDTFLAAWLALRLGKRDTFEEVESVLNIINSFMQDMFSTTINRERYDRLRRRYDVAVGLSREQIAEYKNTIASLQQFDRFLTNIDPIAAFDFEPEEIVLEIPSNASASRALVIFDELITSRDVPFVAINLDKHKTEKKGVFVSVKRYFKKESDVQLLPDWIRETNIPLNIVFKIYMRDNINDYEEKTAYATVRYDFEQNRFFLTYTKKTTNVKKNNRVDLALQRLRQALPSITFADTEEFAITGSLDIRDLEIQKLIFVDVLITNPLLRQFVYVNETQKPFTQKQRLRLHFSTPSAENINISISRRISSESELFYSAGHATRLKKGQVFLHIQVNRAPSIPYADWLVNTMKKLIQYYLDVNAQIIADYSIIRGFRMKPIAYKPNPDIRPKFNVPPEEADVMKRLSLLKLADPDLFIKHYGSNVCQSQRQPTVIREEDVPRWLAQGRQVVKFPAILRNPDGSLYEKQITDFAYQNYYVSNNDGTPWVSLKINTLQNSDRFPFIPCTVTDKHLEVNPKTWDITILQLDTGKTKGDNKYLLSANKTAEPERVGDLDPEIKVIIGNDFMRYGMPKSPSVLLHCILAAHPDYREEYRTKRNKERYVRSFRRQLLEMNLIIAKQEMYDYTVEQIRELIEDENYQLDPLLFYRLVEEFFQIRLFIFQENTLMIPRHKFFHLHQYNIKDVPTILLYRSEPFHVDLIVQQAHRRDITYSFGRDIQELVLTLMSRASEVVTFQFYDAFTSTELYSTVEEIPELNITRYVPFLKSTEWKLSQQTIDAVGKVRALTVEKNGRFLSILVPFLFPLDLPTGTLYVGTNDLMREFASDNNLELEGNAFRVETTTYYINISPHVENRAEILRRNTKIAGIIKQIISTLYVLSRQSVNDFSRNIIVANTKYDISDIEYVLPRFPNYSFTLNYFKRIMPSLFQGDQIIALNARMREGMIHQLRITRTDLMLPRVIVDYYNTPEDFTKQNSHQMVFMSEETLLRSITTSVPIKNIVTTIQASTEPYILQNKNRYYIVQHVLNNERGRATAVVRNWYQSLVNSGYYTEPITGEYQVTEITFNPGMVIPERAIIRVGAVGFAALLPLYIDTIQPL